MQEIYPPGSQEGDPWRSNTSIAAHCLDDLDRGHPFLDFVFPIYKMGIAAFSSLPKETNRSNGHLGVGLIFQGFGDWKILFRFLDNTMRPRKSSPWI